MVRFSNGVYEYEHGKKPRGFGHWAFQYRGDDKILTEKNCPFEHYQDGKYVIVWATSPQTLTNAKKEIARWFSANGFNGVMAVAS